MTTARRAVSTDAGRAVPPGLRGADGSDRIMGALRAAVSGYAALTSRSRAREVAQVDRKLPLVVSSIEVVADDVVAVVLTDPDGGVLPAWSPGAHIDLLLPSGRVRQYSLCGDPDDATTYRIGVRRIELGDGGSREVHQLTAGTFLAARGPRNAFPFAYPHLACADVRSVAFVAGGIGITALLPMIRAAARSNTPWSLTYLGRAESSTPFLDEVAALTGGDTRVMFGRRPLEEVLAGVDGQTAVYLCGPEPLLNAVRHELGRRPHAGFHFERFAPPPVVGGEPFSVLLSRSGRQVVVPSGSSALAAIRELLPDVPYSCQQGFCGTCRVTVRGGAVAKRGTAAFLDGPDTMLLCVDRSAGPALELDL
jgi:ferredoxin-NADP reductase